MSRQMLKTWTVCLIITITLLNLLVGSPLPKSDEIPKTTLDVVLQKFPSLDKSQLDPILVDILDKTCADWQAINLTNSLTTPGDTNAQCLVLYESLASFCLSLNDSLPKYLSYVPSLVIKDMTTAIHDQEQHICLGNQSLYSLKDGEHNISNILQPNTKPINCYLLCGDLGNKGAQIIHDTCKYSYFFASFDSAKLLRTITSRESSRFNLTKMLTQNKTESHPAKADVPETALAESNAERNQIETVKDGANTNAVVTAKPQAVNGMESDSVKASIKVEALAKNIIENDFPEKTDVVAKNSDVVAEKADALAEKSDALAEKSDAVASAVAKTPEKSPDTLAEPDAVAENPVEAEQKKNIPVPKDPNTQDEPPANAENNNSLEANANQDEMEDEEAEEAPLAQAEANGKAEPVVPEETAEIKPPPIKAKPNTVEDEPVSSYNIPEEDMDGDSYFFSYFTFLMCLVIVGYVGYHNRQKILALVLEGKRGKRCGRQTRRPNTSNYHKLDSNLEEAISSSCTKNASNVIY